MKKNSYYSVHKNKKPKKAKYSDPYTKKQKEAMDDLINHFKSEIERLNQCK